MEIKSEPKYETIHLTEILASYPGNELQGLELEDGKDDYEIRGNNGDIVANLAAGKVVVFEARNRNWYSVRQYTNRRLVKEAKQQEPTNG